MCDAGVQCFSCVVFIVVIGMNKRQQATVISNNVKEKYKDIYCTKKSVQGKVTSVSIS